MAEIVILGSGSGPPYTKDRFFSSVALLINSNCYLLDCGEPSSALMFRNGIDSFSTRAVFISHMHADHIGGLAGLLSSINFVRRPTGKKFKPWSITRYDDWYRKVIKFPDKVIEENIDAKLDIFMPSEGIAGIKKYLDAIYLSPQLMPFPLEISPIINGFLYADENIKVFASPNLHMKNNLRYENFRDSHPQWELQSYTFMVEVEGKKIVYSGDIDSLEELSPFMGDVDLVLLETAHYNVELIRPFFDQYDVKNLVFTHIHPGLVAKITRLVKEWNDPHYAIAKDGTSISI